MLEKEEILKDTRPDSFEEVTDIEVNDLESLMMQIDVLSHLYFSDDRIELI